MMNFSKIDRKVLMTLIAALATILVAGLIIYMYMTRSGAKVQNSAGGAQTEQKIEVPKDVPQVKVGSGSPQGATENPGISFCVDECGNNVCQKTDPTCGKDNNLNCICPETPKECPQDCK